MAKSKNIYIILILLPFIDVITSILTRVNNFILTPGLIIKGILMALSVIYIFITKSKHNIFSKMLCMILFLYSILYFAVKPENLSSAFIFGELVYLFKLFYFPIIFFALLCYFESNGFNKEKILNTLLNTLFIYILLLAIPILFGTANDTYFYGMKGTIGWFYAGNEISNIVIMLFASLFYLVENKKNIIILSILPISYIIFSIGTKVSYLGLIITVFLLLIFGCIKNIKDKKQNILKYTCIFVVTLLLSTNSATIENNKYLFENQTSVEEIINPIEIDEQNEKEVAQIKKKLANCYEKNGFNLILKKLLNSRDLYLANTISIYNNDNNNNKILFGIGFSNTKEVDNVNIAKLIEIDIFDAFFHYGVIGMLIMISPFLYTLYLVLIKRKNITIRSIYYIFIILLVIGISTFSGHTLTSPSVAIYVIFYLLLFLNEFKLFNNDIELKNKISILSLHLGYGGIERSIVNQANMLSENFEVEIIVLYKLKNECNYKINKNIKVIYLSNLEPNKKEFMKNVKEKRPFKIFIEGLKSIYILYKKNTLVSKFIRKSNSKIIISTRLEFTKFLNEYGDENRIKIAEEHVYHNNNIKYIKKLKNSLENIDYLIPASQYLTNDYKKYFNDLQTKIVYIPQTIEYLPEQLNTLANKNILFVGRLEEEKGLIELIEIFKDINNIDQDIKLTIVGNGTQFDQIEKLIDKYDLKKHINLTGYLSGKELLNEYKKASLFVMTSFEESFGLVLLEAMSYGIPCFAFDSALGAKEIINVENGLIINKRNKEKMSKEIIKYFKHKNKSYYNKNARKTSEKYYVDNVKTEWEKLIIKVLD